MNLVPQNINEAIKHLKPRSKEEILDNLSKINNPNELYLAAIKYKMPELITKAMDKGLRILDTSSSGKIWSAFCNHRELEILTMLKHPVGLKILTTNTFKDSRSYIREYGHDFKISALSYAINFGMIHITKYLLSTKLYSKEDIEQFLKNKIRNPNTLHKDANFCLSLIEEYLEKQMNESIKHLKPRTPEELEKLLPETKREIRKYLNDFFPYNTMFDKYVIKQIARSFYTSEEIVKNIIQSLGDKDFIINEAFDYYKTYLQIYKNKDQSDFYNYIVLKGNDLFYARVFSGEHLSWKYSGKIDKNKYIVNGTLINKPHIKLIVMFQNKLKVE